MSIFTKITLLCSICIITQTLNSKNNNRDYTLKYDRPAVNWRNSLPLGNGRLGTMITGNINADTLVINEETIWTGGPHDYSNDKAYSHLQEIRKLIGEREFKKAHDVGEKYMIGNPKHLQCYQPLCNLIFDFGENHNINNYLRTLNLNNGKAEVSYMQDGAEYKREYFISHVDDALILRFSTTSKDGLNMNISLSSLLDIQDKINNKNRYSIIGKGLSKNGINSAIKFFGSIQLVKGNEYAVIDKNGIHINGAKEIVLHYSANSNFKNYKDLSVDPKKKTLCILDRIKKTKYEKLLERHKKDFSSLFNRLEIHLNDNENYQYVTTDSLIRYAVNNNGCAYLDEMLYQMGRYLTISASRSGTQPMTLQGKWSNKLKPVWDSKWTLNINLEMNYWMTEAANLSECHQPIFDLISDLYETGAHIAKKHYCCRGFVVHHNTDLWRAAAPVDGANWGLWTLGGAWLTKDIWEHYQYTQDKSFLKKYYKYLKSAALFFFDFLTEDKQGYFVTSPAISFEQAFKMKDSDIKGRQCEGPTMDNQILRDLFNNCICASEIINDNPSFRDSLILFRNKLRPTLIDTCTKEIKEWTFNATPANPTGQIAPLWGVNPGSEINPYQTPELAESAIRTILNRDKNIPSYETSGSWVSGTRLGFWTRLNRDVESYSVLQKFIDNSMFENLLGSFYPQKYFQIDGNLGIASGIMEMIVQSHRKDENGNVIIDIFPALPERWSSGHIKGVKLRGGFELEMCWKDKTITSLKLYSEKGGRCVLNICGNSKSLNIECKKRKAFEYID